MFSRSRGRWGTGGGIRTFILLRRFGMFRGILQSEEDAERTEINVEDGDDDEYCT